MKLQLKLVVFICLFWGCQQVQSAKLLNYTNNNLTDASGDDDGNKLTDLTSNDTGLLEKNVTMNFENFLLKVNVGNEEYTGTIITRKIAVTNATVNINSTLICSLDDEDCKPAEEIVVAKNDRIAYIYLANELPEPQTFKGNVSAAKSCAAGGLNHDPVEISIVEGKVDCQSGCEDFDAVVCDNTLAGILTEGPAFKFINIDDLRADIVSANRIFLDNLTENQDPSTEGSENHEKLGFKDVLLKVHLNTEDYTGTLITGDTAVANEEVITDATRICTFDDQYCGLPEEMFAERNLAFIYLAEYLPEPIIFEDDGDLSAANHCTAGGINHDPIQISINGSTVDCKSSCENYDAVICDNKLAGVLTGGPDFELINVNVLRAIIATDNSLEDDKEDNLMNDDDNLVDDRATGFKDKPEQNLIAGNSGETIFVIPHGILTVFSIAVFVNS